LVSGNKNVGEISEESIGKIASESGNEALEAVLKNVDDISLGKYTDSQIDEIIKEIGDSIKGNPLRQEYEEAVKNLSNYEHLLRTQGLDEKIVAMTMHKARRDLGVKYKDLTPQELREYIYEVNKKRYGDPLGGSFEFFEQKYDGDFSKIIEGAKRPNGDVDKLLENFRKYLEEVVE